MKSIPELSIQIKPEELGFVLLHYVVNNERMLSEETLICCLCPLKYFISIALIQLTRSCVYSKKKCICDCFSPETIVNVTNTRKPLKTKWEKSRLCCWEMLPLLWRPFGVQSMNCMLDRKIK